MQNHQQIRRPIHHALAERPGRETPLRRLVGRFSRFLGVF